MTVLKELENLGVYLDVHHCRLYKGYKETDRLVNDYFDTPRRISMEDICDVMLTKDEANMQELEADHMLTRGGQTNIAAYDSQTGQLLGEESSICSLKDCYNKRIGIEIAGGRLYNKLKQSLYYEWEEIPSDDPGYAILDPEQVA